MFEIVDVPPGKRCGLYAQAVKAAAENIGKAISYNCPEGAKAESVRYALALRMRADYPCYGVRTRLDRERNAVIIWFEERSK